MRAIIYDQPGDPQVLKVAEVDDPQAGRGEVLVAVQSAGINPYDAKVFSGMYDTGKPFPRRLGGDLAGTVVAVGEDATYWDGSPIEVGDKVLGSGRASFAQFAIATGKTLARQPEGIDIDVAGSLNVPGLTAVSLMATVPVGPGDTLLVGGATGAVGIVACQLAVQAGAKVLGTGSARNHDFLESIGVEPVLYGPGLTERVAKSGPITAVWDCHGREALDAGVALGVPRGRMVGIAAYDALDELQVLDVERAARTPENLSTLAEKIAAGDLVFPVVATFPLDQASDAFATLAGSHAPGKIVLHPSATSHHG